MEQVECAAEPPLQTKFSEKRFNRKFNQPYPLTPNIAGEIREIRER